MRQISEYYYINFYDQFDLKKKRKLKQAKNIRINKHKTHEVFFKQCSSIVPKFENNIPRVIDQNYT